MNTLSTSQRQTERGFRLDVEFLTGMGAVAALVPTADLAALSTGAQFLDRTGSLLACARYIAEWFDTSHVYPRSGGPDQILSWHEAIVLIDSFRWEDNLTGAHVARIGDAAQFLAQFYSEFAGRSLARYSPAPNEEDVI